jgi:exopolysaccharide biosynthesis polyprenyl glycosylphosphotransferase
MISDRNRGIYEITLICQCVIVSLFFWCWVILCVDNAVQSHQNLRYYFACNAFLLIGLIAGGSLARVSSRFTTPDFDVAIRHSTHQWLICVFYFVLFNVTQGNRPLSSVAMVEFISALLVVLFLTSRYLPSLLARLNFHGVSRERILIVGSTAKTQFLGKWLDAKRMLGFDVVGLLTDDPSPHSDIDLNAVGTLGELERVVETHKVTNVIMAEFPPNDTLLRKVIDVCEFKGLRMMVVSDLHHKFGSSVSIYPDDDFFFVGLREEPLENPFNRFMKRILDIAVSLPVVILVLPPLMACVWLVQRRQSPGPLFFIQKRDGVRNRPFNIVKFRSMHLNNSTENKLPTSKDDPRLYPAGSFLRQTSLDEMPQFWNVLLGDMSVVGPRPHLSSFNQQYRQNYAKAYVRSFVKPGITGLAQVSGYRGDAKTAQECALRMQADIAYLENWSLGTDIRLILRTTLQMIFPPKTAI